VRDRRTKERAPDQRDKVVRLAIGRGLLILGAGENSIRLCPPLVVTRDQCDYAVKTIEECLRTVIQER
jgi:4-aminobutyrate aminotransferase